jgi:hypothetical protein
MALRDDIEIAVLTKHRAHQHNQLEHVHAGHRRKAQPYSFLLRPRPAPAPTVAEPAPEPETQAPTEPEAVGKAAYVLGSHQWEEAKHPRQGGKFAPKAAGAVFSRTPPVMTAEHVKAHLAASTAHNKAITDQSGWGDDAQRDVVRESDLHRLGEAHVRANGESPARSDVYSTLSELKLPWRTSVDDKPGPAVGYATAREPWLDHKDLTPEHHKMIADALNTHIKRMKAGAYKSMDLKKQVEQALEKGGEGSGVRGHTTTRERVTLRDRLVAATGGKPSADYHLHAARESMSGWPGRAVVNNARAAIDDARYAYQNGQLNDMYNYLEQAQGHIDKYIGQAAQHAGPGWWDDKAEEARGSLLRAKGAMNREWPRVDTEPDPDNPGLWREKNPPPKPLVLYPKQTKVSKGGVGSGIKGHTTPRAPAGTVYTATPEGVAAHLGRVAAEGANNRGREWGDQEGHHIITSSELAQLANLHAAANGMDPDETLPSDDLDRATAGFGWRRKVDNPTTEHQVYSGDLVPRQRPEGEAPEPFLYLDNLTPEHHKIIANALNEHSRSYREAGY